jgi:hypothetical protein
MICAVILFLIIGVAFGCRPSNSDIEITILKDITDTLLVEPTFSDLITLMHTDSTTLQSIKVNCSTITDYEYNKVLTAELPSRSFWLSNPGDRIQEVKNFQQNVSENIAAINAEKNPRPQSNIYSTLIHELNRLSTAPADQKICIVYSDLAQNTSQYSIYRTKDFSLLIRHPDQVQKILENIEKPDNLKGVSVYFVFNARNPRDNEIFSDMSKVFKQIFTSAGAQIFVAANVPHNE